MSEAMFPKKWLPKEKIETAIKSKNYKIQQMTLCKKWLKTHMFVPQYKCGR